MTFSDWGGCKQLDLRVAGGHFFIFAHPGETGISLLSRGIVLDFEKNGVSALDHL